MKTKSQENIKNKIQRIRTTSKLTQQIKHKEQYQEHIKIHEQRTRTNDDHQNEEQRT